MRRPNEIHLGPTGPPSSPRNGQPYDGEEIGTAEAPTVEQVVLSLPPECILSFLYLLCWEMVCIFGKNIVLMRTPPAPQ